MNIQILPLSEVQSFAFQKCLLPRQFFPNTVLPGTLAKCIDSAGGEYICRIYPMRNEQEVNFCWLDGTVRVGSTKNVNSSYLTSLEVLNYNSQPVSYASLIVRITEKLFEIRVDPSRDLLATITKHLLQPYSFVNNCVIELDELHDLGIAEISIKADSADVFSFTKDTQIVISNIQLHDSVENFKFQNLEAMEASRKELQQLIQTSSAFVNLSWKLKPSLNALIVGLPGCGKTSLCINFILENNCNFYIIQSSSIVGEYPGETEAKLRKIFGWIQSFYRYLRPNDPMVILIEDLDLICPASQKHSSDSGNSARISGQLISLLDQLHGFSQIIVLATISNVEAINPALRRPSRFGIEINIPVLTEDQRATIFCSMLKESFYGKDVELSDDTLHLVARQTQGFVVADLALLVHSIGQELLRTETAADHFIPTLERTLKVMKPTSSRGSEVTVYKTEERFDSVGGMEQLKRTLEVSVLAGLKQKAAFERFGLCLPKGVLLYGPPGCAKTTIAKCLATEANMTFLPTSAAEVYSPYVGNSEKYISKIFDTARRNSPCLIFLDEIDSLVGKRTADSRSDLQTRILSTLLTEMDGIGVKLYSSTSGGNNILVVAATNRPEMIDDALMRPGRFDKLIHVPAPDYDSRVKILRLNANKMPFAEDVKLTAIADATEDFSGADICNLCNEAAMHALTHDIDAAHITMMDFQGVLHHQKSSLTQAQIQWYKQFESAHKR